MAALKRKVAARTFPITSEAVTLYYGDNFYLSGFSFYSPICSANIQFYIRILIKLNLLSKMVISRSTVVSMFGAAFTLIS